MINAVPFRDGETLRQQRNLTAVQKKNNRSVKEGVIVNTYVKDKDSDINLSDLKDSYVISEKTPLPDKLYEDNKIVDKRLLPIGSVALGVMGSVALLSAFVSKSAKVAANTAKEKWLPAVTRNVQLNDELQQVIYQLVQSPNKKTAIAAGGVIALSAMGFMGKVFLDGFKDIWVKRKEADIQKNLQENLIQVETESFSGKMQIIRSMLSKYASDFEKYLMPKKENKFMDFGNRQFSIPPFTSNQDRNISNKKSISIGNIIFGIGTLAGIIGLGFLSLKNLSKSRTNLQKFMNETKKGITQIVNTSTEATKDIDKKNLEHLFMAVDADENFVKEQVNLLKWASEEEKDSFITKVITKLKTSTTKVNPNIGGDGTPRPAFNSFVNDYRAFFYNWLLDTSNPQFKQLFIGITGITALSYGGKLAGEAVKDVQVKKVNAQTELDLQRRLVSTELRNFKSKKDSAIQPLIREFYKQVDAGNKTPQDLKNMAENILTEIKNGPPFVYA